MGYTVNENFWTGFEKQAGLISSAVRMVGGAGKQMAQKGLQMASKPGANSLSRYAGNAMQSVGSFARKNPTLATGMVGATALGGAAVGANKLLGSNNKQQGM